jgi:hypothetical protein
MPERIRARRTGRMPHTRPVPLCVGAGAEQKAWRLPFRKVVDSNCKCTTSSFGKDFSRCPVAETFARPIV